jgi:hypothetical protein
MKKVFILIVFLVLTAKVISQTEEKLKTITGKVMDEDGNPLAGANVYFKGLCIPLMTNLQGEFFVRIQQDFDVEYWYASMIGYKTEQLKVGHNQNHFEFTLKKEHLFQPKFGFLLGGGITQFTNGFHSQSATWDVGISIKHSLWRAFSLKSGLLYNYSDIQMVEGMNKVKLSFFTMPLVLEYEPFRYYSFPVSFKAGGFTTYYPFEPKSISIQQKWNYGLTTGISNYWRGFSLNLDAYFGMNDLEINEIKTQNTTYTATLGISFYKFKRFFKH